MKDLKLNRVEIIRWILTFVRMTHEDYVISIKINFIILRGDWNDRFFLHSYYLQVDNMTIGLSCEQLAARMTGKTAIMIMLRRNALRLYLYLLFCRDKACIVFTFVFRWTLPGNVESIFSIIKKNHSQIQFEKEKYKIIVNY